MPDSDEVNKLRWKCRRGMKELDEMLLFFLRQHYPRIDEAEQKAFVQILDMQDPELYFLILGRTEVPNQSVTNVITALRQTPHS